MDTIDPELARRESTGAFVHEIRTPLTSIRMVLEIAKRGHAADGIVLDEELMQMMENSLHDLQQLADAMQEMSRLERGMPLHGGEPAALAGVLAEVRAAIGDQFLIDGDVAPGLAGGCDAGRLIAALCGVAEAVNRCGPGDGVVRFEARRAGDGCELRFEAGVPGGRVKPINADLGYAFYRGHALITAMNGEIAAQRHDRHLAVVVRLPG